MRSLVWIFALFTLACSPVERLVPEPSSHDVAPLGSETAEVVPTVGRCDAVLSLDALCACLRGASEEMGAAACQVEPLGAPGFSALATREGNVFAIARKARGYYALTQLHHAGASRFELRSARIRPAGDGLVLRIVTFRQEGEADFLHTTNEVTLCPISMPRTPGVPCERYPLYAHTRTHGFDEPTDTESRFRVTLQAGEVQIDERQARAQHPELTPYLGRHELPRS